MNNFFNTLLAALRQIRKVWLITALVVLGLVLGLAGYASGAIGKVFAGLNGKGAVASINNQVAVTPTMAAMPGMVETPAVMPAMPTAAPVMPNTVVGNTQPLTGSDMDALLVQMGAMTESLQGMMGQLDQKSANLTLPTATPVSPAIDMQAMMTEMQEINQTMGPLVLRIQADLQGNPSAEELASVRAQVVQINERVSNLLYQLQTARGMAAPAMAVPVMATAPTQPAVAGQQSAAQARMAQLDQMMQQLQGMLQQMQSGSMASQPGAMPGMTTPAPAAMPGMGSMPPQATAMPGMAPMPNMSSSSPSMDEMMMMMDNMMNMMDDMMAMPDM